MKLWPRVWCLVFLTHGVDSGGPRNHVLRGSSDPPGEGAICRVSFSPLSSIGNIRRDRWQQRCGLFLAILQQLDSPSARRTFVYSVPKMSTLN